MNLLAALPPDVDPVAAAAVEADLLARWNEPHRHYHTAKHLASMLSIVDSNATLAALELGRLGVDAAEVVRLILLTTTHDPDPGDRNGTLLADADLSILAAAPEAYDEYAAAVRREYAFVPDDQFRAGRAAVLQRFLDRPTLFRTVTDKAVWTDRAHHNLRRELAVLEQAG